MRRDRTARLGAASAVLLFAMGMSYPTPGVAAGETLEIDHLEPVGELYTQIVTVESHGVRTLYVSGQVGRGETLEEQSKAAYANLERRLQKAGASVDDIVKLVTYVVDWTGEKADAAFAGFYAIYEGNTQRLPAHTLVGVKALYSHHALIEVEAIAIVAAD